MPRAMTLCNGPGDGVPCPDGALVQRGRCPACERAFKDKRNLRYGNRKASNVRTTERHWRMIRARFLRANPTCSHPGCGERATDVHHVVDRADGGTSEFSNLAGYCHPHHSKITAERQPRVVSVS